MNSTQFFEQLQESIARYDLLCHPFYRAWAAGELSRDDLREYARHYYHQVQAFPCYLAEFALRLDDGELRRAVLANMVDEKGRAGKSGEEAVPHAELWLDFAEGMGASRDMRWHLPVPPIGDLMRYFHSVASEGTPEEGAGGVLRLRISGAAHSQRERARAERNVRRRRQNLRLLRTARDSRYLPLKCLAGTTAEAHSSEPGESGSGAGCGRECRQDVVAGSGWD